MDLSPLPADQLRTAVARIFRPRLSRLRTVRVAVEQELFALDLHNGASVAPDRVRRAIAGRPYAAWVGFEPGGQVELSLPCTPSTAATARLLVDTTRALASDLLPRGIVLGAQPVRSCDPATPRYLRSARYDAMERHFDAIGPAGRRMMRSTASTQVCLDWWPGRAGLEQWRVLLLAAPFIAAATARASGPGSRLATWLAVDPGRTAFDDRLLHGADPVAAYTTFAAGAEPLVAGATAHLTTLFPPVRPREGYLEVRFPDCRPAEDVAPLLEGLAALLYDDDRRRAALTALAGEQDRLGALWEDAAQGRGDAERGEALLGARRRSARVAA